MASKGPQASYPHVQSSESAIGEHGQQQQTVTEQPRPNLTTANMFTMNLVAAFRAGALDYNYTTSLVMTLYCLVAGGWCALPCTIIAIFVAKEANKKAEEGDRVGAEKKGKVAYWLNIAALIIGIVSIVVEIILLVVIIVVARIR